MPLYLPEVPPFPITHLLQAAPTKYPDMSKPGAGNLHETNRNGLPLLVSWPGQMACLEQHHGSLSPLLPGPSKQAQLVSGLGLLQRREVSVHKSTVWIAKGVVWECFPHWNCCPHQDGHFSSWSTPGVRRKDNVEHSFSSHLAAASI